MQIGSQVGGSGSPLFPGRGCGAGALSATFPPPVLCTGLCRLGLCVAVTQIVVGESGSGGAVRRISLII